MKNNSRVRADAKRRIVRMPIKEDNLRTFSALPKWTRRWKTLYRARSALERINSRIDRDFKMEHHYIRGLASMQIQMTLRLTVMLALSNQAIKNKQPHKIRSLHQDLAA